MIASNAFGGLSEQRDDRVAERMLAMLGRALTADEQAAARTTLRYNTLGKLVAKIDPQTPITLANGYAYRDRPTTSYGYDLLGRLATQTDANGNLTRQALLAGSQPGQEQVAAQWHANGGVRSRGTVQWLYGGAQLLSDQGWAAGNAATGGWLADNVDVARAAVERNAALGKVMLSLPEHASTLALRAFVGNVSFDEVKQGFSSALRLDEISGLEARGDFMGAQALRTQNALNIGSALLGGVPATRSAFSLIGSAGQTAVHGLRIAAEDVGASIVGQRLAASMERLDYNLGLRLYAVAPEETLAGGTLGSPRLQYMGGTPDKYSRTGRAVV